MNPVAIEILFGLLRRGMGGSPISEALRHAVLEDMAKETPTLMPLVYRLAKAQGLLHVVGYGLEAEGLLSAWQNTPAGSKPKTLCDKLYQAQTLVMMRHEQQRHALQVLSQTLEGAGIDHMPLKGAVLQSLYPHGWMRSGCDIDILVREDDLPRAEKCLTEQLGYTPREGGLPTHDMGFVSGAGVVVELHFSLNEPTWRTFDLLTHIWDHAIPVHESRHRYEMANDALKFYHIAHMAKHFVGGGCGVRPVMDVWLFRGVDQAETHLREAGLWTFAKSVSRLADVWFGDATHDETTQGLEAYILSGGSYGSLENLVKVRSAGESNPQAHLWRRVFLPYEQMVYRYPILKKHPWLTPFFEVVRWFSVLFGGGLRRVRKEMAVTRQTDQQDMALVVHLMKTLELQ